MTKTGFKKNLWRPDIVQSGLVLEEGEGRKGEATRRVVRDRGDLR